MNLNDRPEVHDKADYEADFTLWLEAQLLLLRERQFDKLDLDNLFEEVGGILRSERREVRSRLDLIVVHLLKCQYQPQRKSKSWLATLRTQRTRLGRVLQDSPSLRRHILDFAHENYRGSVEQAAEQTGLARAIFPAALPYSEEQLLDADFVP
ncbi:DUF29 domain-containing protein [Massilia sp. PAMC28688]|uniref:DUF29 domain-containing protein n=1 Tax=Massilia sp. PAMC28688 TaxID=2861283 RepID=UPI001C62BE41|nr:DUF29 domain-containing protein [Massilia sp. PAMC28688]QYF92206.1 DUF29 domain-containing protein [Massilia sp. PAMC28688]